MYYDTIIEIGNAYIEHGRYKDAITHFTKVIADDPNNSRAYELRGTANYFLQHIEEAIADETSAIEANKENHFAWSNRGMIFLEKMEHEKAKEDLSTALDLVPGNRSYRLNLAFAHLSLNEFDECLDLIGGILHEEPNDYRALLYTADCLRGLKAYEEAERAYNKLLYNYPSDSLGFKNRASLYLAMGEKNKAHKDLVTAIELGYTTQYNYEAEELLAKNFS